MRELKYGAYHKKLKKMFNVHSLLWSGDRLCWAVLSDEKGFLYNDGEEVEIEYLEILQFIGLCDKTGRGGYHKDICKFKDDANHKHIGTIEWIESGWYLVSIDNDDEGNYQFELSSREFEIIGNVFESDTEKLKCQKE